MICIAVYFFRLTRPALRSGFSPDDCMNLYRAWYFPLSALARANLLFFLPSDFFRPFGEAWYRAIYFFAGFRPAPFHAVEMALLVANIFLVYALARRLAGSRFAGLTAALLFAYQERWTPLYFDTGYIYDVLCAFFFFAAMLLYIAIRQAGRTPRRLELAALAALYVCALNSKEIAVALPAALALYEALFEPNPRWRISAVFAAAAAVFLAGRAGALTHNAAYAPQFTWNRFAATTAHFIGELLARPAAPAPFAAFAFAGALLLLALALRSKPLLYSWGFTAAAALPIAFIPPRGGPQYYIPLLGCALFAGCLLHLLGTRLMRILKPPAWGARVAAALALAAIAWPIYSRGKYVALRDVTSITQESPVVMGFARDLRRLRPTLPHGARLLLLRDPFSPRIEDPLFIVRLVYRDHSIELERVARTGIVPGSAGTARLRCGFRLRRGPPYRNPAAAAATPSENRPLLRRRLERDHAVPSGSARYAHHRDRRGSGPRSSRSSGGPSVSAKPTGHRSIAARSDGKRRAGGRIGTPGPAGRSECLPFRFHLARRYEERPR